MDIVQKVRSDVSSDILYVHGHVWASLGTQSVSLLLCFVFFSRSAMATQASMTHRWRIFLALAPPTRSERPSATAGIRRW